MVLWMNSMAIGMLGKCPTVESMTTDQSSPGTLPF